MISSYSNGWGHLIATIAVMGMVTFLIAVRALDTAAAIGLASPVISFWFMSGAVNRFNSSAAGASNSNATANNTTLPQ